MNLLKPLAAALALAGVTLAQAAPVVVTVHGTDDLYNATGLAYDGTAPVAIDVTGLTSITFSVSAGNTVTVNSGGNYNDADGVGAASGETNYGSGTISGIAAPTAGYIAGAFLSGSAMTAPAGLNFTAAGLGTSFASLSPLLSQAFFIGDGLTGDGVGATQTFYVPTGATALYLGLTDACGYNGTPSCYSDNSGSFTVTATGVGNTPPPVAAVPEPGTWALMIGGLVAIGYTFRRRQV